MTKTIGLEVQRSTEDILEELMPYRNAKVEKEIDMPAAYKFENHTTDEKPENAFYKMHADSTIRMTPQPMSSGSLQDIAEIVNHTSDAEAYLRAKPEDITTHAPILEQAGEALSSHGLSNHTELYATARGKTISETIDNIEDQGAVANIWITNGPKGKETYTEDLYSSITYDSETSTLTPNIQKCRPDTPDYIVEEVQEDVESVLEDEGLLK